MFIGECVSEKKIKTDEYLTKFPAKAWLSHAIRAPGKHTGKRQRQIHRLVCQW